MNPPFSLATGFHAVVIGGAGDIGAAIANLFCDLGAMVSATGGQRRGHSADAVEAAAGSAACAARHYRR